MTEITPADVDLRRTVDAADPHLFLAVEEFSFSVRVANTLQHLDVQYVGELVQKTEGELLRVKHFGRRSLFEVKDALADLKPPLRLGMQIENWPAMLAVHGRVRAAPGGSVASRPLPVATIPRVLVDLTTAQRNFDAHVKRAMDRIAAIDREIVVLQAERAAIDEGLKAFGRST